MLRRRRRRRLLGARSIALSLPFCYSGARLIARCDSLRAAPSFNRSRLKVAVAAVLLLLLSSSSPSSFR